MDICLFIRRYCFMQFAVFFCIFPGFSSALCPGLYDVTSGRCDSANVNKRNKRTEIGAIKRAQMEIIGARSITGIITHAHCWWKSRKKRGGLMEILTLFPCRFSILFPITIVDSRLSMSMAFLPSSLSLSLYKRG